MSGGDDVASIIALARAAGSSLAETTSHAEDRTGEVVGEGEATEEAIRTQAMQVRAFYIRQDGKG